MPSVTVADLWHQRPCQLLPNHASRQHTGRMPVQSPLTPLPEFPSCCSLIVPRCKVKHTCTVQNIDSAASNAEATRTCDTERDRINRWSNARKPAPQLPGLRSFGKPMARVSRHHAAQYSRENSDLPPIVGPTSSIASAPLRSRENRAAGLPAACNYVKAFSCAWIVTSPPTLHD